MSDGNRFPLVKQVLRLDYCIKKEGCTENTYRLHQHIVLSEQKCGSGVLVERFNIVPHPHERAIIHATTGLSLLNLTEEVLHICCYIQ